MIDISAVTWLPCTRELQSTRSTELQSFEVSCVCNDEPPAGCIPLIMKDGVKVSEVAAEVAAFKVQYVSLLKHV